MYKLEKRNKWNKLNFKTVPCRNMRVYLESACCSLLFDCFHLFDTVSSHLHRNNLTLTLFSHHRSEFDCFQIELAKNYGIPEWREDLRNVMMKAGLENKPMVFLFSDTQVRLLTAGQWKHPFVWLTFIQCLFYPRVTAVAHKRPRSFCQKCRWQVTPKHAYTLYPAKLAWADYAAVQA